MVIEFNDEESLRRWGKRVGKLLKPTDLIFLRGVLGAGKTTLVKAMAEGYGVDPDQVTSPTFNLHHQMENSLQQTVHHIDGYRVENPIEYDQIGLDLLPEGLMFVEWPDLFQLAQPTVCVSIEIVDQKRRLTVNADELHPVIEVPVLD